MNDGSRELVLVRLENSIQFENLPTSLNTSISHRILFGAPPHRKKNSLH